MTKILNLYAGIGGNRRLWGDNHKITAVEIDERIAGIYKSNYPNDEIIITDAHQFLLNNYKDYDFIWASPPCPTHSKLCFSQPIKQYIDMKLYQEIVLLKTWYKGYYCVENVIPYYEPLIKPSIELGRHLFWSNFTISYEKFTNIDVSRSKKEELSKDLGMPIPVYDSRKLLRNCLNPKIAKHILECLEIHIENQKGMF